MTFVTLVMVQEDVNSHSETISKGIRKAANIIIEREFVTHARVATSSFLIAGNENV
jgi:hypothetical protein